MSNKNKPTLSLGAKQDDPPVSASPEPIKLEEEFVSIAGLASQGRENLLTQLRAHAAKTEAAKEYVPPERTERQQSQLEREMEAGRRGVAKYDAQKALYTQPKPVAADGYTTPVFRPGDHVPNFDSKDPAARTLK